MRKMLVADAGRFRATDRTSSAMIAPRRITPAAVLGLDAGLTAPVLAALWFQVAAGALVNQPIRAALRARLWRCLSGESPSCEDVPGVVVRTGELGLARVREIARDPNRSVLSELRIAERHTTRG
jgi:hypothetical protein